MAELKKIRIFKRAEIFQYFFISAILLGLLSLQTSLYADGLGSSVGSFSEPHPEQEGSGGLDEKAQELF